MPSDRHLCGCQNLADHIPGAEFVTLDSDIHLLCVSDVLDELAEHMSRFLTRVA